MYYFKHNTFSGLSIVCDEKDNILARVYYHDFDTDEQAKDKAELITNLLNNNYDTI